jgi:hypothetical protein
MLHVSVGDPDPDTGTNLFMQSRHVSGLRRAETVLKKIIIIIIKIRILYCYGEQCSGSMPLIYGSGSGSWIRFLDPDPAIFLIDLQDANKKLIF